MNKPTSSSRKTMQRIKRSISPLYYEIVYLLATPKKVNTMNYGYAPITEELRSKYPSSDQGLQYELYWQVFSQITSPLTSSQVVCEVSSGRGGGLAFLRNFTDANTIGLERSPSARRYAKKYFGLDTRAANAPSLPLDDSSVDVFLSVEAFHNYHNDALVAELQRCLKPGGIILVADMNLGPDEKVRNKLINLYKRNGLNIESWRDVRPNIIKSLIQDNDRKLQFMKYCIGPFKDEAKAYMGVVGSHKYNEMEVDERAYFIFCAKKPLVNEATMDSR